MNPLSIRDALKLYSMLSAYLPDTDKNETWFTFTGKIMNSILESGHYHIYTDSIALMMNTDVQTVITELDKDEILKVFIEGLETNKMLFLKEFCKKVGWNG